MIKRVIDKKTNVFIRDDFEFNPETEIGLEVEPAQGFYKPKWNGDAWEEGATQEYIDSLKPQPHTPTETELLQVEIAQLKTRLARVEAVPLVKTVLEPVAEKTIT